MLVSESTNGVAPRSSVAHGVLVSVRAYTRGRGSVRPQRTA